MASLMIQSTKAFENMMVKGENAGHQTISRQILRVTFHLLSENLPLWSAPKLYSSINPFPNNKFQTLLN